MTSNLPRQTRMAAAADSLTPKIEGSKTSQTLIDAWIEPPLRAPVPSFMDEPQRGIERHGVLQTMAPLGTPPSAKIKKQAKADGPRGITLKMSVNTPASATPPPPRQVMTPEPVVDTSRRRSVSQKLDDTPKTPHAQTAGHKSNTSRSSIPRQSLPPHPSPSMSGSPTKQERDLRAMDRIVQSAVEDALTLGKYPTAYAIRTLYNDHRSNPRITSLIDTIYRQRADQAQLEEFRTLMHYKKKEGRDGEKAKRWFDENDNAFNPPNLFSSTWSLQSSPAKKHAPESNNKHVSKSPDKESSGHVSKKHKANNYQESGAPEVNGKTHGNGIMENGSISRSRSNSSTSSLSSLDEELLNFSPANAERSQAAGKAKSNAGASQSQRNHSQPIALHSTPGPKLHAFSTTNPITSSSTIAPSPASLANTTDAQQSNTMPAAYSEPAVFSQPQPSSHPISIKLSKKLATGTPQPGEEDREERLRSLKRRAKAVTETKAGIKASFERHEVRSHSFVESESDADSVAPQPRGPKSGTILRFRPSQANRKANDESDGLSSPTLLPFNAEMAPGSSVNSRAGTPTTLNRPSRKPKGGSGLRTKTS
jgi:hypothetical protein